MLCKNTISSQLHVRACSLGLRHKHQFLPAQCAPASGPTVQAKPSSGGHHGASMQATPGLQGRPCAFPLLCSRHHFRSLRQCHLSLSTGQVCCRKSHLTLVGSCAPAWPSAWISPETGSREGKGSSVGEIGQRGHWCVKAGQRGKCLSQRESRQHSAIHNPLPEDRSSASYLPPIDGKKENDLGRGIRRYHAQSNNIDLRSLLGFL